MQVVDKAEYLKKNGGLIRNLANKFYKKTSKFSFEDLVQEGSLAAIHALDKHDPENNKSKLSTYVYSAVNRRMRDLVRTNTHDAKVTVYQQLKTYREESMGIESDEWTPNPMAVRLDQTNDAGEAFSLAIPSGAPPALDEAIKKEQVSILLEEIDTLPDREKNIIRQRYLDGDSAATIAREQGCTRQRIHEISTRAMRKLSVRVKSRLGGELYCE